MYQESFSLFLTKYTLLALTVQWGGMGGSKGNKYVGEVWNHNNFHVFRLFPFSGMENFIHKIIHE